MYPRTSTRHRFMAVAADVGGRQHPYNDARGIEYMNIHRLTGLAKIVAVVVAMAAAPAVLAEQSSWDRWRAERGRGEHSHGGGNYRSVPEFDPAAAGALSVLLAGGALFFANRRRSK